MKHPFNPLPVLATVFGLSLLTGCGTVSDAVSSLSSSLTGASAPAASMKQVGVAATPAVTASIRAAMTGDAAARTEVVKLGYKSPQQVMAALNELVQARGGVVKAANYRAQNTHNNGLDGGSLTLYVGDAANANTLRWWVDVKVYADANLNTVVEGVYKVANTPRGKAGEGYDLMQDLRSRLNLSKFDDRLPPAFLIKGDLAGF